MGYFTSVVDVDYPAATNLVTNGGFETNDTGYISSSGNTTVRSTAQAKFGSASGLCTYGGTVGSGCAVYGITLTAAAHAFSAWVYVPAAFDGGGLSWAAANWTSATVVTDTVDMNLRDQWQRVVGTITPDAGDLSGDIRLTLTDSQPTAGNDFVYIDGVQVETGSIATPYIETDGGTASRLATGVVEFPSIGEGWAA